MDLVVWVAKMSICSRMMPEMNSIIADLDVESFPFHLMNRSNYSATAFGYRYRRTPTNIIGGQAGFTGQ